MKYRQEIDGLRCLAVCAVILYHFKFSVFSGGFLGVDIFFVISGYLLSVYINENYEKFSFQEFYLRRARRIIPLLLFICISTIPFAFYILIPKDSYSFFTSIIGVVLLIPNIIFWKDTSYFDGEVSFKPLIHTWSLGVEEQFYLLFPILYLLVLKLEPIKRIILLLLLFFSSFLLCLYSVDWRPVANFYLLPTRIWEFMAGSLGYIYLINNKIILNHKCNSIFSIIGLLLVIIPIFLIDEYVPYPSLFTLPAVIGTFLIIVFCKSHTLTYKFLAFKPFVFTGLISYSLYLWHQPIISLYSYQKADNLNYLEILICLLLIFSLSFLSWNFIELPFRNKLVISTKKFLFFWLISSSVLLLISITILCNKNSYKEFWLSIQPKVIDSTFTVIDKSKANMNYAWNSINQEAEKSLGIHGDGYCRFDVERITLDVKSRILHCFRTYGPGVAVIGDSHAVDLFGMIISGNDHPFIVGITQGGCRPHTFAAKCQYADVEHFLNSEPKAFKKVIFEQAGFYLLRTSKGGGNRKMFLNIPISEPVTGIFPDHVNIKLTYEYLHRLSQYVDVVWFGPRVEPEIRDVRLLKIGCEKNINLRPNQYQVFKELDSAIASGFDSTKSLRYISQIEMLQIDFSKDFWNCKESYWADEDHYSAAGEIYFGKRLNYEYIFN